MLPFCLPFEQSFLVLSQDVYGSFLRESRIGQSLLHFGNLHIRFFQLFFEPRLFGCSVNHALERKIQITKFGTDSRRPLWRFEIRIDVQSFSVEQEFDHLGLLRRGWVISRVVGIFLLFSWGRGFLPPEVRAALPPP